MVNVRARVAELERNRPQLSVELRQFLDLVWSNRARIALSGPGTGGKLYGLYARRPKTERPATPALVLPFLRRLEPLSRHPIARPHWIQGFDIEVTVTDLIEFVEDAQNQGRLDEAETQEMLSDFGFTFYHLPRSSNRPSGGRIYLNVSAAFSVEVMSFVIRDLVAWFPDALKAKLAGPCNIRADRIVIWVTNLDRINDILGALAEYQRTHRAFFMDGIPRLCKEVSHSGGRPLRGVGIASEPPARDGRPISYGKSRTNEIFRALDDILGANRNWWTLRGQAAMAAKEDFITMVASHLKKAGIDPAQVHI